MPTQLPVTPPPHPLYPQALALEVSLNIDASWSNSRILFGRKRVQLFYYFNLKQCHVNYNISNSNKKIDDNNNNDVSMIWKQYQIKISNNNNNNNCIGSALSRIFSPMVLGAIVGAIAGVLFFMLSLLIWYFCGCRKSIEPTPLSRTGNTRTGNPPAGNPFTDIPTARTYPHLSYPLTRNDSDLLHLWRRYTSQYYPGPSHGVSSGNIFLSIILVEAYYTLSLPLGRRMTFRCNERIQIRGGCHIRNTILIKNLIWGR